MTIYNRQYQKLLSSELLRYLLLGTLPNLNDISSRVRNAVDSKSNITYKYLPQAYREVFKNKLYNRALGQIKFDIDVFHEELIQMFADASSRLNFADLYHKVNSYELKKLQASLELLLFTIKDADFYFDGFVETFSDTSKVDNNISTTDIVDLSEQCLALPYGGKNTQRISVGSLIDYNTTTVDIPSSINTNIISKRQIPGTKFGDIFTDTLSVWGYEVVTETNGPLEISFTFPLNPDGEIESEFFVSRFEVIPHSDGKQTIKIQTSNDDVNYISLIGYEQGITLENQKTTYALDFETTLVQYVRITLRKQEADEELLEQDRSSFRYLFGLKKFGAYQTGRVLKGTYYSKPISFPSNEVIGKVSINVNQFIPAGCQLNYSVAGIVNGSQTSFIPITPIGQEGSFGSSQIIKFNTINKKNKRFTVTADGPDAPAIYGTAFQGKQFYRIGEALKSPPIFGTNLLYRGYKVWSRDASGSFEIVPIKDTYVSFEVSDLEAMYALATELSEVTILPLESDEIKRISLSLANPPYYDSSRGHALKPQPGTQNSLLDTRPNYAVYKVIHKQEEVRKSTFFTLNSSRTQYLPVSNFILQSSDSTKLPEISYSSGLGGATAREGIDYIYETVDIGGQPRPTGRIIIPENSGFLGSAGNVNQYTLVFTYYPDSDITHKVTSIQNNKLTLEHSTNSVQDSIEVTYRYIPVGASQIIKSSIRVSNLPSTSPSRIFYVEGTDYVVDAATGTIQRIPTGSIPSTGSVYIEFSYRESSTNLQTFSTWCYISPQQGAQIKFDIDPSTKKNKLIVDEEEGESFFVNYKDGLIDLTKTTSTPVLPFGWVQFIVRSKNPDTNQSYKTNLIDQVIQLKDENKRKVFRAFNNYFNEITAFREPLIEKTVNHLKVNTLLSDHSNFAIDSVTDPFNSYIILNFKPNETNELYSKVPTADSDETNAPESVDEDFFFIWNEKTDEEVVPKELIVKVDLSRNQEVDGALSPKVFDYQLRVGT